MAESIPLASAGRARAEALLGAGVHAAGGVGFGLALFALFASGLPFFTEPNIGAGLALGGVVAGGGVALAALGALPWLGNYRAELVIEDESLTIHYPGLAAPLRVGRSTVELASIDTTASGIAAAGRRFRICGISTLATPGIARFVMTGFDVPNLIVMFRYPVVTTGRRWMSDMGLGRVWRGGRAVQAIALSVAHPDAARVAFSAWGVLRTISPMDLAALGFSREASRSPVIKGELVLAAVAAWVILKIFA